MSEKNNNSWPDVVNNLIEWVAVLSIIFIIASCVNKGNVFLPKSEPPPKKLDLSK